MNVIIDGIRYVPATNASTTAADLLRALALQWHTPGTFEQYGTDDLRIVVSDGFIAEDGETFDQLATRLAGQVAADGAAGWSIYDREDKPGTAPPVDQLVWIHDVFYSPGQAGIGLFDGFTFRTLPDGSDDCLVTHWQPIDVPAAPTPGDWTA